MSYFERSLPIALIFGSFFAIFVPLLALQLAFGGAPWLQYLTVAQAVGLGTTHFFITLAVYFQSQNLAYFNSSARNRVVYFAVPAVIFLLFAWSEAAQFRTAYPQAAMIVFGGLRFLDFFHVGRQSVGMLQLWKRPLAPSLPSWTRPAENAFFVAMAAMQWVTFVAGGRFASGRLYAIVPAAALGLLFVILAAEHLRHARASAHPRRFLPFVYFAMQAFSAACAVVDTRLYLLALTLHYTEYHVIMAPRLFRSPLTAERAVDRFALRLRARPWLFYALLATVVILFELRNQLPAGQAASTTFFVHLFDGIFLVHYFIEAFLWKFGNPYYRAALAPLYFAPAGGAAKADAPAPVPPYGSESPQPAAAPAPAAEGDGAGQGRLSPLALGLCLACLLSGAAALAFEALWFHQAGLALGNSVWASSLILSGFMAGMALGNAVAARLRERGRSNLLLYAALEGVIGVTGVSLVYVLPALPGWLAPLLAPLEAQPFALNAVRLALAFLLLLPPSTAMGMTLPLLVHALRGRGADFGRVLGLLYGVNTAGAVVGVLAVELGWLPAYGIRGAAWCAFGLNAGAALLAFVVARRSKEEPETTPAGTALAPSAGGVARPLLLAAFGSGFALLGLEVIWLRFVLLFLNDTRVAFAVILALVLCAMAAGGFAASALCARYRRAPEFAPLAAFACGGCALAGYLAYPWFLQRFYAPDQGMGTIAALAAPLVVPASFMSGLLFALLGAGLRRASPSDLHAAGRLTFANTIGAGLGSALAGFVLLPRAGMERSLFVLFALYAVIGLCAALATELGRGLRYGGLALLGAGLCFFPFGDMTSVYVRASASRWMTPGDRLAQVREGLTATLVHVVHGAHGLPLFDQLATNAYSMTVNDFAARRYMKLFVLLPQAIQPRTERALVVGYGIGSTVAALTASPELKRIDVVDIASDVLELSRAMHAAGSTHPLDDPRVRVHIEDGRYFLQASGADYDLITGEPPPPVMAGVVSLYTQEYFELMRARLREGGIASYWLPTMNISAGTTKSIIRAFCGAFEDCTLWHGSERNFMLMGTRPPPQGREPVSEARFTQAWADPGAREELAAIGFEQPEQLGALFIGDARFLGALAEDALPLIDDRPQRMLQPGTREESDAITWQLRDTAAARGRFLESDFVSAHFPDEIRRKALRQYENQRLIDDLLFSSQSPARQTQVLHQVLHGTQLRFPVLLLLLSDPDIERALRAAPPAERARAVWLPHLVASALADRDYTTALGLLERTPDEQLALADLRQYVGFVLQKQRSASAGSGDGVPALER